MNFLEFLLLKEVINEKNAVEVYIEQLKSIPSIFEELLKRNYEKELVVLLYLQNINEGKDIFTINDEKNIIDKNILNKITSDLSSSKKPTLQCLLDLKLVELDNLKTLIDDYKNALNSNEIEKLNSNFSIKYKLEKSPSTSTESKTSSEVLASGIHSAAMESLKELVDQGYVNPDLFEEVKIKSTIVVNEPINKIEPLMESPTIAKNPEPETKSDVFSENLKTSFNSKNKNQIESEILQAKNKHITKSKDLLFPNLYSSFRVLKSQFKFLNCSVATSIIDQCEDFFEIYETNRNKLVESYFTTLNNVLNLLWVIKEGLINNKTEEQIFDHEINKELYMNVLKELLKLPK